MLEIAAEANLTRIVKKDLKASKYEEAAQKLVDTLPREKFRDIFEARFGDGVLKPKSMTGAVALIPKISYGPVITTNFDHVLERVFQSAGCPFDVVVWGEKADLVLKAYQRNRRFLLKIHGDVEDSDDRVLTLEEYRRHYGELNKADETKTLPKLIRLMLESRPVLFLGCSLQQDRTVSILQQVSAEYRVLHFAILERPATKEKLDKRERSLYEQGIRPVWYPPGQHNSIASVLKHLAEERFKTAQPQSGFRTQSLKTRPSRSVTPGSSIPKHLTSFVGRQKEIEQCGETLAGSQHLVTLCGVGGCGKTRLAEEVVHKLEPSFPDGIWWVQLAALKDPSLVPQKVASALGLKEQLRRPAKSILANYLRDKTALLVLDNFEQLLKTGVNAGKEDVNGALDLVKEVLSCCPEVRVLVTSRQRLNLEGEVVLEVKPLAAPRSGSAESPADLAKYESVNLFIDRAKYHAPGLDLAKAGLVPVAEICRRLDGIPLAIELAAARLRVLSVEEVARRLKDRFELITAPAAADLPQHQTLRAVIDWSYDLLTEAERVLLRKLSVFSGQCELPAIAAVCSPGVSEYEVLDVLAQIVDKYLVVAQRGESVSQYDLLETIREYAREKLVAAGESAAVRNGHRDWFLQVAERESSHLLGAEQARSLAVLAAAHDDLRSALGWSIEKGDTEQAHRLAAVLWRFWDIRGYLSEGRRQLAPVLAFGNSAALPASRAEVLSGAGMLAYRQGEIAEAEKLFLQSLEIQRSLKNEIGIADALNDLGNVAQRRGDFTGAQEYYQQSLMIQKQRQNSRGAAVALFNLGDNFAFRKLWAQAQAHLQESYDAFHKEGNEREAAFPLNMLGLVALAAGDLDTARENCQRSYDIRKNLDDKRGMAECLNALAKVALGLDDGNEAAKLLEQSLTLFRDLSDKRGTAECFETLARLAVFQKDPRRCATLVEAAKVLRDEAGVSPTPLDGQQLEECESDLRSALESEALASCADAAKHMSFSEMTTYAAGGLRRPPAHSGTRARAVSRGRERAAPQDQNWLVIQAFTLGLGRGIFPPMLLPARVRRTEYILGRTHALSSCDQ